MPTAYEILGIQPSATQGDIKKAYMRLALRWHPDKNLDEPILANEKMREINEAYEHLIKDGGSSIGLTLSAFYEQFSVEELLGFFSHAVWIGDVSFFKGLREIATVSARAAEACERFKQRINDRDTPYLLRAVQMGYVGMIAELIALGADVNLEHDMVGACAHAAAIGGNAGVFAELGRLGANFKLLTRVGSNSLYTPAGLAVLENHYHIISTLLKQVDLHEIFRDNYINIIIGNRKFDLYADPSVTCRFVKFLSILAKVENEIKKIAPHAQNNPDWFINLKDQAANLSKQPGSLGKFTVTCEAIIKDALLNSPLTKQSLLRRLLNLLLSIVLTIATLGVVPVASKIYTGRFFTCLEPGLIRELNDLSHATHVGEGKQNEHQQKHGV